MTTRAVSYALTLAATVALAGLVGYACGEVWGWSGLVVALPVGLCVGWTVGQRVGVP